MAWQILLETRFNEATFFADRKKRSTFGGMTKFGKKKDCTALPLLARVCCRGCADNKVHGDCGTLRSVHNEPNLPLALCVRKQSTYVFSLFLLTTPFFSSFFLFFLFEKRLRGSLQRFWNPIFQTNDCFKDNLSLVSNCKFCSARPFLRTNAHILAHQPKGEPLCVS